MNQDRRQRIEELFAASVELRQEARAPYLSVTTDDAALREEVLSLLQAHDARGPLDGILERLGAFRDFAGAEREAVSQQRDRVTDVPARLQGAVAELYTIERELGHGGMATVYLARDRKHGRHVALKIVAARLGYAVSTDRFLREIEIASRLNHPHIVPLFDSGAAEGFLYYVMPHMEGESLRERLAREGPLPVEEALRITREVADALDYAHRHGVIHRDIKPGNILLEDGHAMVADFGIARAITAAEKSEITATGVLLGTPAYMSPEQSAGREVDQRSDLYSLGCVLYEMLEGRPPFTGPSSQAVLARHLADPVPTPERSDVPPGVIGALATALAKKPDERFTTADEFARTLAAASGTTSQPLLMRRPSPRRIRRVLGLAAALLAIGTIAAGTRLGWVSWRRAAASAGAAVAPAPNSVAVLYFSNLSPDTADAYLADGLTEELILRLGQIERLEIKSRAAVERYGHPGVDPVAAGRALRVGHLVSGTVRRAGDRLRVTVELVRLPGGDRLWGERYDRSGMEVWAIQADIARRVATAVAGHLAPVDHARLGRRPTASPDAYDHYLRGNYHLSQRSARALTHAVEEYAAAARIDARFTAALARLAYAYALLNDWNFSYAGLPPESLLARGLDASDRALRQDSSTSEAWMARGYLLIFRHPETFEGATAAFARAVALDSVNAEAHHQYGWILAQLARDSAAAATYHRALALEPERAITLHHLALLRTMQGRFAEARRWLDSALVIDPGFLAAYSDRARVHLLLDELARARADAEMALRLSLPPSRLWSEATMALVEAREGNVRGALERVEAFAREAEAPTVEADYLDVAAALATAGDHERALGIVDRVRPRGPRLWSSLRRPELDPIRSHARFQRVLEESRPPSAPR